MLHSGSRSLGKTICDAFHKRALAHNTAWYSELPHPELAYLPVGTDGLRRLLGGDGVRAPVRRGEPVADARQGRGRVRAAHLGRADGAAGGRAPQLRGLGEPLRARTGSCTARAPFVPGPARRSSSRVRWAPRRTSRRARQPRVVHDLPARCRSGDEPERGAQGKDISRGRCRDAVAGRRAPLG